MKIDLKRDAILIIPESDQDRAFIEDTLKLTKSGDSVSVHRIDDVILGFAKPETFVLKVEVTKS